MCTGAPGGVWARTFARRLSITCRSRTRSPRTTRDVSFERDRPVGLDSLGGLDRLTDERAELDGLALQGASLVETGEQQQVVDQHAHPGGLALDSPHRAREIVGSRVRTALEQLCVGANRGERSAQLVRGVGDEAPQLALGGLERAQRRLDLRQHRVEGDPEPADLRARLGALDAPGEIAGAIAAGGAPIAASGRRPSRTTQVPRPPIAASTSAVTSSSTSRSWCSVLSTPPERCGDQQDAIRLDCGSIEARTR